MVNVLIIEDDPYIASDIKMLVDEMEGFSGFIASDMPNALNIAEKNSIQIALFDIQIKGLVDGIDTAHMLQSHFSHLLMLKVSGTFSFSIPAKISMEATEVNKILNVSLFGVGTYNVGLQTSPLFFTIA